MGGAARGRGYDAPPWGCARQAMALTDVANRQAAFMLYRMKKKDEGSYSLEEPKQANGGAYQKPTKQEEFYA